MAEGVATPLAVRRAKQACAAIIGWALLFGAAVAFLYLAPSLFMMQVYDRVLVTGGVTTLLLLFVILAVSLLTLAFLDTTRTRLLVRMSLRLDRLITPVLMEADLASPGRPGAANTRAIQSLREFDMVRQTVSGPPALAILDLPWAPLYFIVCFMIHPWIGFSLVVGAAILLLLALRNERAMRRSVQETSDRQPRFYAAQEQGVALAGPIRALGMRGILIDRQLDMRQDLSEVQAQGQFSASFYTSATKFVRLLLQSFILGLGAYLAVEGKISPGALIAGSILGARALAPLEQVVAGWRQISQARAAYRKVADSLNVAEAAYEGQERVNLPAPAGGLRFESVSVALGTDGRMALHNVSFAAAPGEVLGIVGLSGAGKSTLTRIAVGAITPHVGIVRLDQANLADWDPDLLGPHIGYAPQEPSLLPGTIAENIRRFCPRTFEDAAEIDAATIDAAKEVGVHEIILHLPQGYNTQIIAGGGGLSMGQAQRVALARAFFRKPALLVLDEPNAHLDAEGEAALLGAIARAKTRGAVTLLSAHRASVLAVADRILFLRNGQVEAIRSREDVAKRLTSDVSSPDDAPKPPAPSPSPPASFGGRLTLVPPQNETFQ